MNGILDGMRVIEGSAFVAAPLGGMTLAQLGADVIRFDPRTRAALPDLPSDPFHAVPFLMKDRGGRGRATLRAPVCALWCACGPSRWRFDPIWLRRPGRRALALRRSTP